MLELLNNISFLTNGFVDGVADMGTTDFCSQDGGLYNVVLLIKNIITLLKWAIPFGLIIFGLLDLGKAVMAGKEDEMKKAQGTLIKRVMYAVAVFLVITIVTFVMGMVGGNAWKDCWDQVNGDGTTGVEDNQ